jgi:hypothetical protein
MLLLYIITYFKHLSEGDSDEDIFEERNEGFQANIFKKKIADRRKIKREFK